VPSARDRQGRRAVSCGEELDAITHRHFRPTQPYHRIIELLSIPEDSATLCERQRPHHLPANSARLRARGVRPEFVDLCRAPLSVHQRLGACKSHARSSAACNCRGYENAMLPQSTAPRGSRRRARVISSSNPPHPRRPQKPRITASSGRARPVSAFPDDKKNRLRSVPSFHPKGGRNPPRS